MGKLRIGDGNLEELAAAKLRSFDARVIVGERRLAPTVLALQKAVIL
jgi:hypothetical protein